jgi:UDP-2-acetamido-2-deoxy-ribo-hexuluronate aminotransferase
MSFGLKIPFVGLRKQYNNLRQEILDATDEILRSGQIMSGNYTIEFENWLARRNAVKYAVTCHSGTQALEIMARYYRKIYVDVPRVLIPTLTYPATVNAFLSAGWEVHLTDTDNYGLIDLDRIDPSSLDCIILIGLYGAPIEPVVSKRSWISRLVSKDAMFLEDAAQHWLSGNNERLGVASAISFDPTKNLNNYGNGGAIVTNDSALMYYARSARDNGKPNHGEIGTNSRISEVDAAQMMVKTRYIDQWQQRRRDIAKYWIAKLKGSPVRCLIDAADINEHAIQKFVIDIDNRDTVRQKLATKQIETRIHYERPCHELGMFHSLPGPNILSCASALSRRILSLPIYPELTDLEVEYVADQLLDCVTSSGCNSKA